MCMPNCSICVHVWLNKPVEEMLEHIPSTLGFSSKECVEFPKCSGLHSPRLSLSVTERGPEQSSDWSHTFSLQVNLPVPLFLEATKTLLRDETESIRVKKESLIMLHRQLQKPHGCPGLQVGQWQQCYPDILGSRSQTTWLNSIRSRPHSSLQPQMFMTFNSWLIWNSTKID